MSVEDRQFFSVSDLLSAGFSGVGTNVRVSRKASLYAISGTIGSHVRIDDFCTIKGRVKIGSFVHIAGYCSVSGAAADVTIEDFVSLANRVSIYAGSDDYRASVLNGPMVPHGYVKTISAPVTVQEAVVVGAHCVILPGVTIGKGASIGAGCVIANAIETGAVVVNPAARGVVKGRRSLQEIQKAIDEVRAIV